MKKIIDVIVPTYNRYHALPEFFENNKNLNREDIALWIIDDFSSALDMSVIPPWSNLSFIRLTSNQGQAHARNVAIEKSNGIYIISLDDDAWFENGTIHVDLMIKLFDRYPDAGCMMFNISTPVSPYSLMQEGTMLSMHVTCGCAYRRIALNDVGAFSGFLHSGAEEVDLSFRLYRAGWSIRFAREIKVFHDFVPHVRSLAWYYNVRHNTTRNDLLIVVMYYPLLLILPFVAGKYFSHLRFAVNNKVSIIKALLYTILALFDFFRLVPQAIRRRKPLSFNKFRYWRALPVSSL
jgi:GT2 family glycosyltransferase